MFGWGAAAALSLLFALACEQKQSRCLENGVELTIGTNHGHSITILSGDVARGAGKAFPVAGGDHEHTLETRDDHMHSLKKGQATMARTTEVEGHFHTVGLSCKQSE